MTACATWLRRQYLRQHGQDVHEAACSCDPRDCPEPSKETP